MRDLFKDSDLFDQQEYGMKVGLKKMKEIQNDYQTLLTSTNESINSLNKYLMNSCNSLQKMEQERDYLQKRKKSLEMYLKNQST